jgi:hypothetical protein
MVIKMIQVTHGSTTCTLFTNYSFFFHVCCLVFLFFFFFCFFLTRVFFWNLNYSLTRLFETFSGNINSRDDLHPVLGTAYTILFVIAVGLVLLVRIKRFLLFCFVLFFCFCFLFFDLRVISFKFISFKFIYLFILFFYKYFF